MNRQAKLKRRLRHLFHNPANGLEYNQISANRQVSRRIYDMDIARNPRIVSSKGPNGYLHIDVQEDMDKVNGENSLINTYRFLVEGRT